MSNNSSSSSSGGIGFAGLLTVLFVGLKLTGYIAWSWLWVLSPLWIGLAVALSFLILLPLVVLAVAGIVMAVGWVWSKLGWG